MDWTLLLAMSLSTAALVLSLLILAYVRRLSFTVRRYSEALESLLSSVELGKAVEKARRVASLKPRRRYIVFEIVPGGLSYTEVERALDETLHNLVGIVGGSSSRMKLLYFDEKRSRGILRVRREYKYLALAVLGLTRTIAGQRVIIIPLAVTGSVKRAKRLVNKGP